MSFLTPLVAYAQESDISVKELVFRISEYILNPLINVMFAVAVVYLVWKIILYVKDKNSGYVFDPKDKQWGGANGISGILWGLLGLFIMASAFVIMRLLAGWIGSDIPTP